MEGTENDPKNKPPKEPPKAPPAPPPPPAHSLTVEQDPLALARERAQQAKKKGPRKNAVEQPEDFMTQLKARQSQMNREGEVVVENTPTAQTQDAAEAKPVVQAPKPEPIPLDENGIPVPPPLPPQNLSDQKHAEQPKAQTPKPKVKSHAQEAPANFDLGELQAALLKRSETAQTKAAPPPVAEKPTPGANTVAHKKTPVPTPRAKAAAKPAKSAPPPVAAKPAKATPKKPLKPTIAPKPVLEAAKNAVAAATKPPSKEARKAAEHFKKNPVARSRER